jgi:hypothetical protein
MIGLAFVFAVGFELAARMTNPAGGVIPRDVVAGGGGRSTAGSNVLYSTIGQPATALSMAPNGSVLVGGFQTMVAMRPSTAVRRWDLY